jgi:hypothetical protein
LKAGAVELFKATPKKLLALLDVEAIIEPG